MKILQNQKLNTLIVFALTSLLLTNIWVIIYTNLLSVLNYVLPVSITQHFYRLGEAFPEKFEIPLYLLLTLLFVIIMWIFYKNSPKIQKLFAESQDYFGKSTLFLNFLVLVFLLLLFLTKLGLFPLSHETYPYQFRPDKSLYALATVMYLSILIMTILESVILFRFSKRLLVSYLFVTICIAVLIFEPRFPISPLDYAFFYGPIWEISKGKTIFTDIPSQYGFLSILFFALLFKLKLFAFSHLAVWNWIFHVIQYFICYYVIYKISKSIFLGLIGLFSIITLNYYSFYVPVLTIAQYGALRRLPFFIGLFLFYKLKKIDSPLFIFLYALLSFWIVDTGIQMILAYGLTLFYLFLAKVVSFKRSVKATIQLLTFLVGIFLVINFFHLIFGWKMINTFEIVGTVRQYAISGVGMLPIESHTFFWFVILVYFASIMYFFRLNRQTIEKDQDSSFNHLSSNLILFSANISLFASLYFVGRSDNASLIIISIFPLLNVFILLAHNYQLLTSHTLKILLSVVLFIVFIGFPVFERSYTISELLATKYRGFLAGNIFHTELEERVKKRFAKEKATINTHIPDNKILVLSSDDTYLLYFTDKINLLDENPQSGITSDVDMKSAIKTVAKICPKKIAVDCSIMNKCPRFTPFTKGWITAGYILKEVESRCHIHYEPTYCTNQLCIAQGS